MWVYLWDTNLTWSQGGGELVYKGKFSLCYKCPNEFSVCFDGGSWREVLYSSTTGGCFCYDPGYNFMLVKTSVWLGLASLGRWPMATIVSNRWDIGSPTMATNCTTPIFWTNNCSIKETICFHYTSCTHIAARAQMILNLYCRKEH